MTYLSFEPGVKWALSKAQSLSSGEEMAPQKKKEGEIDTGRQEQQKSTTII